MAKVTTIRPVRRALEGYAHMSWTNMRNAELLERAPMVIPARPTDKSATIKRFLASLDAFG